MAIINKIRQKSVLLFVIIGVAMLAFILGDYFNSRGSLFGNNKAIFAEIGGKEIKYKDFLKILENEKEKDKKYKKKNSLTPEEIDNLKNQIWNEYLYEYIYQKEFEKVGIVVSEEELYENIAGDNPHRQVVSVFTDPRTNKFDKQRVLNYIKNLDALDDNNKNLWLKFERDLQRELKKNKYLELVTKSLYTTKNQLDERYKLLNTKYDIEYVLLPYDSIKEKSIQVSDNEIEGYYNKNKSKFKVKNKGRLFDYVKFSFTASQNDYENTKYDIEKVYKEFSTTENDTDFVKYNYENKTDGIFIYNKISFPKKLDSSFFYKDKGSLLGPILEGNIFRVYKIVNKTIAPDSVRARHILISKENDSLDKVLVDSIYNAIIQGASFIELSKKYSKDQSSSQNGGDLGWFGEGKMIKEFNDFCFKPNKMSNNANIKIVKSNYGYHIVKIDTQTPSVKKIYLATISRSIEPSNETIDSIFALSIKFYNNNNTPKKFQKTFESNTSNKGYEKRSYELIEGNRKISGLSGAGEVVRWVFNQEEKKVSEPIQLNKSVIIINFKELDKKEYLSKDKVRNQIEKKIREEKKLEYVIKKYKNQKLETITINSNKKIYNDIVDFGNVTLTSLGNIREPEFIGKICSLEKTKKVNFYKGNSGVFIARIKNIILPDDKNKDLIMLSNTLDQMKYFKTYSLFNDLNTIYDIKDYRYNFY